MCVAVAACGGVETSSTPAFYVSPTCWQASPKPTSKLVNGDDDVFAALWWGHGLDALDRMLAPAGVEPDDWDLRETGPGFELRRTGQRESDGGYRISLELRDLEEPTSPLLEHWQGSARATKEGWRFELEGRSGVSQRAYVQWGDRSRGCGEGLRLARDGGALRCWSEDGELASEARCRALELQLRENG